MPPLRKPAARTLEVTVWQPPTAPHLGPTHDALKVGTYNVHRWKGPRGGRRFLPGLATAVIREMGADVLALQEVVRPDAGPDPLFAFAEAEGLYLAYVPARPLRSGELGNAILSRWPIRSALAVNLTLGRLEQRTAVVAQLQSGDRVAAVAAAHLAIMDRTRHRQVQRLLRHPGLQGPVVLLGDMNAWRRCRASRQLDDTFLTRHHNQNWPASFPSTRPLLALDRVYARDAHVTRIRAHNTAAARRGSDHLPVVARVELDSA